MFETLPTRVDQAVWRGSRPVTPGDMQSLKRLGIKTIVNLMSGPLELLRGNADDEIEMAESIGLVDLHLQMHPLLPPREDELDAAVEIMSKSIYQPVYVHCLHGHERTGFACGAYGAKVLHQPWEKVYSDLVANGFHQHLFFWWLPVLKQYVEKYAT